MDSANYHQHVLRNIHPLLALYESYKLAIATGIVSITPDLPFEVLLANVDEQPQRRAKR